MTPNQDGNPLPNPYVGPEPFAEGSRLYGRERETQELSDLLISKRVIFLFSPSGAGKTSLIRASLIPRLREEYGVHALPIVRLNHVAGQGQTPANRYVFSALRSLEKRFPEHERYPEEDLLELTLESYLAERPDPHVDPGELHFRLIVFDQFEELFTLDPLDWDKKREFLAGLGDALAMDPRGGQGAAGPRPASPALWALFSMREDHVAELEPFLHLIPTALAFRYRLDPLEVDEALEAVVQPALSQDVDFRAKAASQLVDDLRRIRILTPDGQEAWELGRFVEPVQLEVVCLRLWDRVVRKGRPWIDEQDLTKSQGANEVDSALAEYFDAELLLAAERSGVRERELRDWIERELITAGGVRKKVLKDPAALGRVDRALDVLIKSHLVALDTHGGRAWIELAHDRLVGPVNKSNADWRDKNLRLFQKQAALWDAAQRTESDMLFTGASLLEAERCALEHPEDLSEIDRAFVKASQQLRAQHEQERKQTAHISRLLSIAKWSLAAGACLLVAVILFAGYYFDLARKHEKVVGSLNEAKVEVEKTNSANVDLVMNNAADFGLRREPFPAAGLITALADQRRKKGLEPLPPHASRALAQTISSYREQSIERSWHAHSHIIWALAFTDDGSALVSGGWDRQVRLWPLSGGKPTSAGEHSTLVLAVAYSKASNLLATSDDDGGIILWRLDDGALVKSAQLNTEKVAQRRPITSLAFSPDGESLAAAMSTNRIARWVLSDLARPPTVYGDKHHKAPIRRVAYLGTGKAAQLVSADMDGRLVLWSPAEGDSPAAPNPEMSPVKRFDSQDVLGPGKSGGILALAASPAGRWIATGDSKGNVVVWDGAGKEPKAAAALPRESSTGSETTQRDRRVLGVAFSADGLALAATGPEDAVSVWELRGSPATIADFAASRTRVLTGWQEKVYGVTFHPTQPRAFVVGGAKRLHWASLDPLQVSGIRRLGEELGAKQWNQVRLAHDGSVLSASSGNAIHLWRRKSVQDFEFERLPSPVPADRVAEFAMHADGSAIVTVTCDGKVAFWEIGKDGGVPQRGVTLTASGKETQCVVAVALSPDGHYLAVAVGKSLSLWSSSDRSTWSPVNFGASQGAGEPLRFLFTQDIRAIAFGPRSDVLVAAGSTRDDKIRLWKLDAGRVASGPVEAESPNSQEALALSFCPDARTIAMGTLNFQVSTWETEPRLRELGATDRHRRAVRSVACRALDGVPVVFSADREGAVWAWFKELQDRQGAQLLTPPEQPVGARVAASADGTLVATAGRDLLVWDFRREWMLRVVEQLVAPR